MSEQPGFELVAEFNPPGSGAWEGAVQDVSSGQWYIGHSLGSGEGKIHRFKSTSKVKKPYLDSMVLHDLTHIYGFGVDKDVVWAGWDGPDGNDLVKFPYSGSNTVDKSFASKLHVFTENPVQVSFSDTRVNLVLMETFSDRYRFTKRRTGDILKNKDDILGKRITVARGDSDVCWLQGFSISSDSLYVLWGRPDEKAWIDKYSFGLGQKIGTLDVTSAGYLPGEPKDGREPEGMDARTFGVKVHHDDARRLRVFKLNNF